MPFGARILFLCVYVRICVYIHIYISHALYANLLLFLTHFHMFPSKPTSNPPKASHSLFNELVCELIVP